jgi:hypothetical protein
VLSNVHLSDQTPQGMTQLARAAKRDGDFRKQRKGSKKEPKVRMRSDCRVKN